MSNSLAIAAVTATLRNLLETGLVADLPGTEVTTSPLDKARNSNNGNQVNLYLYQTEVSAAWRNMDMPGQVWSGETSHPPLGLNLNYLITAYGANDNDTFSHRLLGRAMNILHDHALLGPDEIESATENELPGSDLHNQVERVRITHQPLNLDEMSKLWTTFQTQYRISAACQVAVVLIESTRSSRTPLPVLTRGPNDKGVKVLVSIIHPFPTIESVGPPNNQPSARLEDILTLTGHHLYGDNVVVRFTSRRLTDPIERPALDGGSATKIRVELPDNPAGWPAGFFTISAFINRAGEQDRETNELPFSLAPRILAVDPNPAPRDGNGNVTLTASCSPQVRPEQHVAMLLGDHEIVAQPHPTQTDTLEFRIEAATAGEYYVRLRVDGVDSLLVDRSVSPPVFDETQKVTIT